MPRAVQKCFYKQEFSAPFILPWKELHHLAGKKKNPGTRDVK